MVEIRPAYNEDIKDIQQLLVASWRHGYDGIIPEEKLRNLTTDPTEFYPEERFDKKRTDSELIYLVGAIEGKVVGIVNVCSGSHNTQEFVPDNAVQIRSLYVHPDVWRDGVGTQLVTNSLQHVDGYPTVVVECLEMNCRGRKFYSSLEFKEYDSRTIDLYGQSLNTVILYQQLDE
ncbi:GNAT family N-acetyltransferase [Natrialba aegyptia]|uniref:GNAT family N-acetyltransferase n=1 Tax=Natrialba aegyptia TaxID=129789 RepID=UPI001375B44D|nr:GNAT family N-acetyltransferase [Natrialba aegyptia]